MLRHFDQHGGGVWVYTRNLLREIAGLDVPHKFVLIYSDPRFVGTYGDGKRIREVAVKAPHPVLWDQFAVAQVAKREKFDLIFNPKYSIPLNVNCPTVWVCHGLDWYLAPEWSRLGDRLSHRFLIPQYARKARAIIAVSNTTKEQLRQYLSVKESRVHTVYHGLDETFSGTVGSEIKEQTRLKHKLPDRFFLYVGQIYPPKNFGRLLEAFARVGPSRGIHLVVAGTHTSLCKHELKMIRDLNLESWVLQAGWVDHDTLPAFYAMATALVMPSLYESFGMPVLEAMSAGCPVLTADRHGTRELAEGAAILVNPEQVEDIAQGMSILATNEQYCARLIQAGRQRASSFSWQRCAVETLRVLEASASTGAQSEQLKACPRPALFADGQHLSYPTRHPANN
jgi:glycosyltransferase involved in cell wall biosynthesis